MTLDRQIQVSTDLAAIADMAARLHSRALDRSSDRLMPGGDALVALAGVADMAEWTERLDQAERAALEAQHPGVDVEHELPDEMWPPLQLLRFWSDDARYRLGMDHPPPWQPDLFSEAGFLRNADVAAWLWDNEPRWEDYAADVARARTKLETILLEGTRVERSNVVCDRCDDDRPLVLIWAKRHPVAWECDTCGDTGVTDPDAHDGHDLDETAWESDEADDRWLCKGCRHKYDAAEVEHLYAKQTRQTGAVDRYLPLADALDLLRGQGWQKRTVRGWLGPLDKRKADRCDRCRTEHEADEHDACPWCGYELRVRWKRGSREAVVQAYCEVNTRRVMLHWPSLWRRQMMERQQRIVAAREAARRAAIKAAEREKVGA